MILLKGKNCGFCFGVKRAVSVAESLKGDGNFILGDIIHNELVNEKLRQSGVVTVDSVSDERMKNGDTLLIRTHGEPENTFIKAKERGLNVIDCTCPFVKQIHKIVREKYLSGYKIIIFGNSNHPEIKGINGWCNNSADIVYDLEGLKKSFKNTSKAKICIVTQTTFAEKKFDDIIKNFTVSDAKTVDIFKTICYTTTERQREAEKIAHMCDVALVLGGAKSNNTDKLFNIMSESCSNVFRITDPKLFDYEKIKNFNKVGIVFGASTPEEQFQEVIHNMENITEEVITTETVASENETQNGGDNVESVDTVAQEQTQETEKTTETTEVLVQQQIAETQKTVKGKKEKKAKSEMEAAFDNLKPNRDYHLGQVVTAKIASASESGLMLSLNSKKDFELPKEELLTEEYNVEEYKNKIDEEIRVMVVGKNPLKLSEKAMQKVLKEEAEVKEIAEGRIFEVQITATNKGGLVGKLGSYEVFVPASQIRLSFVKDLDKFIGKTLRLKAEHVENRRGHRQIVASQRVILQAEKDEKDAIRAEKEKEFFDNVQEGDVVLGTPVRFNSFGAFIEVNGFDCLAHIAELSWAPIKDCAEVLEIGKTYEFKVLKLDVENKKVSLGYKQLQPKPWDSVLERYNIGDTVTGKVVRLVSFGAFVEIEKGIDGLVHVSQISNQWLENPVTALQVGQEVTAKILDINPERERMNLSIKALLPEIEKPVKEDKKKKNGEKEEEQEVELREWKDDATGEVSIAEMLGNDK